MNPDGTAAEYLTYLGGSTRGTADPDETVTSLQLDAHGHVYVSGETSSPDFPGRRVVQPCLIVQTGPMPVGRMRT